MSSPQKTALIIGASGYIGGAVARAFARGPYLTLGLIRASSSDPHRDLAAHNVNPIVGSASDIPAAMTSIRSYSTTFDVIVIATEDRSPTHFDNTVDLVTTLAKLSNEGGNKPLVIFTSGCKDYGPEDLDGAPNLKPHTEESPLNTPPPLAPRAQNALRFLEDADLFDAVVTRPTNVHGYSSSYYGELIEFALVAKEKGLKLKLPGDPRTIMHSVHVDDCGEAYLAIAEHPNRKQVAGEVFNISPGQKYETLSDVASALEKAFQLKDGVECVPQQLSRANVVFAWSQWVGSEKLRQLTAWKDTRPMFAEDMGRYRKEFEEAVRAEDVTLLRVKPRFEKSIKHHFPYTES
jgi:nucleoside-diphosphate-sugar epimerase